MPMPTAVLAGSKSACRGMPAREVRQSAGVIQETRRTTKPSDTACRMRMGRPSVAMARTRRRNGGLRPDSMASELSVTCRSGNCADPLCTGTGESAGVSHELGWRKLHLCVVECMLTDMLGSGTLYTVWCSICAGGGGACSPVQIGPQSMRCEVAGTTQR